MPSTSGAPRASAPTPVRSVSAAYALHFQIPRLPQPTPPSLLKRQTSNSSSASSQPSGAAAGKPPASESCPRTRRRSPDSSPTSSASSSFSDGCMPATPLPVVIDPIRRPLSKRSATSPTTTTYNLLSVDNIHALNRPTSLRRDTPRPRKLCEDERISIRRLSIPAAVPELDLEINDFEASFSSPCSIRITA